MLLLVQEWACLKFCRFFVAANENVVGPASAKCEKLTEIYRIYMLL